MAADGTVAFNLKRVPRARQHLARVRTSSNIGTLVASAAVEFLMTKLDQVPSSIQRLLDSVTGSDVDHALQVASTIIMEGEWRTWMVRWFIRRHRGHASRLMRRLGPLIPPQSSHQRH